MALEFRKAAVSGERYKRPIGRSQSLHASYATQSLESNCSIEQVHFTLGNSNDSIIVSYATYNSSTISKIWYTDNDSFGSTLIGNESSQYAIGSKSTYSQLLQVSGQLLYPNMGQPHSTTNEILAREDTSQWAYDKVTGEHYDNYEVVNEVQYGFGLYSNPYMYYDSPYIHTVIIQNLSQGITYYYQPEGSCTIYHFKLPRQASTSSSSSSTSSSSIRRESDTASSHTNEKTLQHILLETESSSSSSSLYPYKIGVTCDLGQTAVSNVSISALQTIHPEFVLIGGDLSYADGWTPMWDSFGRMIERLGAYIPILTTGGNHEFGSESWQSYMYRWPTPYQESGSTHFCYWGKEIGVTHIISLCSYAGSHPTSSQYIWLTNYLLTKIDRVKTPWIIVMLHVPLYNTNVGHWKEAELFRVNIEPLLYEYGVDIVIAGHVHSYERTYPVYNNQLDSCGITHLNLGDGGNREGAYVPWRQPPDSWSAFREASFGVGELEILSTIETKFSWHRHACDSDVISEYHIDFSDTCVTVGDNSMQAMLTSDIYHIIKPSKSQCPNKWKSSPNLLTNDIITTSVGILTTSMLTIDTNYSYKSSGSVSNVDTIATMDILTWLSFHKVDINGLLITLIILICFLTLSLIIIIYLYYQKMLYACDCITPTTTTPTITNSGSNSYIRSTHMNPVHSDHQYNNHHNHNHHDNSSVVYYSQLHGEESNKIDTISHNNTV